MYTTTTTTNKQNSKQIGSNMKMDELQKKNQVIANSDSQIQK